jgi:hypothetical protein
MLAMVLASYYFALAQRKSDVPYMWIERNLILIFMSNLAISFYLYDYAMVALAEPGFILTIIAVFSLIPALLFACFYDLLKPVSGNIYVFEKY